MVRSFRLDEADKIDETKPFLENEKTVGHNVEAMVSLPSIDSVLPEALLCNIFDFLLLKDLQAFGLTCRRNRDSVNKYLYREYKTNSLEVKTIPAGVVFGPNTRGLFESQIAMLKIHTYKIDAWTIIAARFTNVKKIFFNKTNVPEKRITPEHGIVLKHILQEAESIEFMRNAFADEHGRHILNHCQKLKHLVIGSKIFKRTDRLSHFWMKNVYRTLEDVRFDFGFPDLVNYDEQGEKIRTFFINNPSIKHLTILANIEDSLNFIHQNGIRLQKLTLRLETNVNDVINLLNDLHINGQIHSYGLIFQNREILETHAQLINELNGLEFVYMKQCNCDWATNYPAFFNKIKVLHIGDISPEGAKLLASNAVHLKEIYIVCGSMEIIDTFVSRAANLMKIALNEVTGSLDNFDWTHLIKSRIALTELRQLYINVPEATYIPIKWKEISAKLVLTEGIPNFDSELVKIKRVESLMPYRPF